MVALFSHQPSSTLGLQLEEAMIQELRWNCPVLSFPSKEQEASYNFHQDLDYDDLSFPISPSSHDLSNMTKKLSHNAYERDRRKKLNDLYSSLRSLLPETEQNKKLSIPCTISRVVKYIPELQRQVQRLSKKKEEMALNKSRERRNVNVISRSEGAIHPIISATCLNNKQVMMQICVFNKQISRIPLSKVLRVLEVQGLQLIDGSTFTTKNSDQTFYSLHLQAKETINMDFHLFCDRLVTAIKDQSSFASSNACNGGT
ncbi:protein IRON-RELATED TRANSCRIPTION FACTOR 2-like [Dioscorea cayenensis subsp. rotundata]|uniref:Protein IRON-RELATED TRANSCRIPTION FACTOR 2 n=1 Tax=Dioscorea cayennensis subsp. rotundata TaxID=55577 RepID=A0AB40C9S6_DIOCR|nr:protein IRON-RELATED TRANSCRIPTION FACTOR 2-like [Dioscorea cayenensis subsp. rotundata]